MELTETCGQRCWLLCWEVGNMSQIEIRPSNLAQAVTFLIRVRELPGSNLGRNTDYPKWGLSQFSSVPPGKCWDNTWSYTTTASFHILFSSLFTSSHHWTLFSPSYWKQRNKFDAGCSRKIVKLWFCTLSAVLSERRIWWNKLSVQ
jgi:hypothetical protein